MKNKFMSAGLVYSTESGRMCPDCRKPVNACVCKAHARSQVPPGDGVVRIARETKGRGGKVVVSIKGLAMDSDALASLGKELKMLCGTGGTTRDGVIEIQGDHVERVMVSLQAKGYMVKRISG